tara:strand:- start:848 stop:1066 length:219 start_codon:yes stop_codon:yes gene_type:complete
MEKGDLVKAKQGTIEGDPESLGIGVIIEANLEDGYGGIRHRIAWTKNSLEPWLMYEQDLELVSEGQRRTGER